jgi:hypothetical protein
LPRQDNHLLSSTTYHTFYLWFGILWGGVKKEGNAPRATDLIVQYTTEIKILHKLPLFDGTVKKYLLTILLSIFPGKTSLVDFYYSGVYTCFHPPSMGHFQIAVPTRHYLRCYVHLDEIQPS